MKLGTCGYPSDNMELSCEAILSNEVEIVFAESYVRQKFCNATHISIHEIGNFSSKYLQLCLISNKTGSVE